MFSFAESPMGPFSEYAYSLFRIHKERKRYLIRASFPISTTTFIEGLVIFALPIKKLSAATSSSTKRVGPRVWFILLWRGCAYEGSISEGRS